MKRNCIFLSHRGESDDAPENTAESFKLAMARDSDGIELDIRMCGDGRIICCHDASLLRVAGKDMAVAEHSFYELTRVHPVPLFAEALDILLPGKMMQVELKGEPFDLTGVRKLFDLHLALGKKLSLSSFEVETLQEANEKFQDVDRVLLTDLSKHFGYFPSASETAAWIKSCGFTGVSFKACPEADRDFVNALHEAGLRVVCWGVFTDELGLMMAANGVDALTCNHAVALRKRFTE